MASKANKAALEILMRRRRKMLDVIRGSQHPTTTTTTTAGAGIANGNSSRSSRTTTRVFAMRRHHFASLQPDYASRHEFPLSPADFHSILCDKIEKANRRICLASLYVGPAVDAQVYRQEARLLESLSKATKGRTAAADATNGLNVKILLDKSRGLRPVPIVKKGSTLQDEDKKETITSAEACRQALAGLTSSSSSSSSSSIHDQAQHHNAKDNNTLSSGVYLHSVLPPFWQKILPNPIDEVAGVFHIKIYIIDDELILSGANLSQEYFTDRHDRYLHILDGGNGLVDWYADFVDILCQHSEQYRGEDISLLSMPPMRDTGKSSLWSRHGDLIAAVQDHFQEETKNPTASFPNGHDYEALFDVSDRANKNIENEDAIVAVACPTFQAPAHYGTNYRSDRTILTDLLQEMSREDTTIAATSTTPSTTVRIASAYLNPTQSLQNAWQHIRNVHCMTAGYWSHGFRPKEKAGNKGRPWIPAIFDVLVRRLLPRVNVWYYTRPDWTFHAKGLWLSSSLPSSLGDTETTKEEDQSTTDAPRFSADEDLIGVTHGSGNYGERSEYLDMESNLYLVLPPGSPLIDQHKQEWNTMCDYSRKVEESDVLEFDVLKQKPHLRLLLPWIKRYF